MKKLILVSALLLALVGCDVSNSSSATNSIGDGSDIYEQSSFVDIELIEIDNVAVGKTVYSSSQNNAYGMVSTNAVDGDEETSWSSDTSTQSIDEWIIVDLGENYDLEYIIVKWGKSYSQKFSIEISRGGSEFTEVYSTKNGNGKAIAVSAEGNIGRYVRISCKDVVSVLDTYMGATIQEIEISGAVSADRTLGGEKTKMAIKKTVSVEESDVLRGGRSYKFNTLAAAGSTYEYQCTGRVAGAVITGEAGKFEVSIDGGEYKSFQIKKGTQEYLFSDKLEDGVHTVRITRQSESWDPVFTVDLIIIEDTADIVKNYQGNYDLKIEFVGDSLTSAQGVDYSQSYVVEACRILNAHFNVISRGGMGIYRNYDDTTYGTLPTYYQYTEYQNPRLDKPYTYDADIVVFNMGGNDAVCQMLYHRDSDAKKAYVAEYEKLYYDMLDEVFTANPNAFVICCYGQLGSNTAVFDVIEEIVEKYRKDHPERRIEIFEFKHAIDYTVTNDGHPGPKSHKRDGEDLAKKIKELLG